MAERITNKQIMDKLEILCGKFDSLEKRVEKLEATPSGKGQGRKGSAGTGKGKKPDKWGKYAPKKAEDGNYIWRSYKACRQRWLNDNGFSYEEAGWMSKEEFAKAAKPFTDKFGAYVPKANRK